MASPSVVKNSLGSPEESALTENDFGASPLSEEGASPLSADVESALDAKGSAPASAPASAEEESKERDEDDEAEVLPSAMEKSVNEESSSINKVNASAPLVPNVAPVAVGEKRRTNKQKESDAGQKQIASIYGAKGMKIGAAIARGAYYAELKAKETAMKNGKSEEEAAANAEKVRNDYVSRAVARAKTQRIHPVRASRITTPKNVKEVISRLRNGVDDILRNAEAELSLMLKPRAPVGSEIKKQAEHNLRTALRYSPPARLVNAFATTRANRSGAKASNFLSSAETAGIYKPRGKGRTRRSKSASSK